MARNRYDMDEVLEDSFDLNQLKRLAHYIAPYKGKMAGIIFLMLSASALTMMIPIFFQRIMDYYIPEKNMKAIVTVVGKDRVGIIASVCVDLASFNVNVLDISQTVMQGYFTMMMVTDVSEASLPVSQLAVEMENVGKEMGLSVRLQREDIFESMHRI